MSTRCYIMVKDGDTVTYNFVGHDGYLVRGVGELLKYNYATFELAKCLCSIGDRSALEDEETYTDQEEVIHTVPYAELNKLINNPENCDIAYYYLFIDGGWQVACSLTNWKFYNIMSAYAAQYMIRNNVNVSEVTEILNFR